MCVTMVFQFLAKLCCYLCNISDSVAKAGDADVHDDDLEDDEGPNAGEPGVSLTHLVDGLPVGARRASGSLVGGTMKFTNRYLECERLDRKGIHKYKISRI